MVEVYVLIERRKSMVKTFIAWLCLCLAIACIVLACSMYSFFVIGVVLAALWYWIFFKSGLEYEYSYFDGDLRFAKVIGKSRRKALGEYSIDDVVQIAPAGDRSVYKYENDKNLAYKDLTSGDSDAKVYELIAKGEKGLVRYEFEPDDEMLDEVMVKYPRSVVR